MNGFNLIKEGFKAYPSLNWMVKDIEKYEYFNSLDLFKLGFLFIGSDTLCQNEFFEIVSFLENNGIEILSVKIRLRLTNSEVERVFLFDAFSTLNSNSKYKWWVINDTIVSGPVVGVFVRWQEGGPNMSCLDLLHKLKGNGDPFKGVKGTIRNDFSAISYSMNLVHTPDNYSCLIKDCSPFVSISELNQYIKNINHLEEIDKSCFEKFCVKLLSKNQSKLSIFNSMMQLKISIILNLNIESDLLNKLKDLVIDCYNMYNGEKQHDWLIMCESNKKELFLIDNLRNYTNSVYEKDLKNKLLLLIYENLCDPLKFSNITREKIELAEALGAKLSNIDKTILINFCEQY